MALLLAVTKDLPGWAARTSVADAGAFAGVELDGRTLGLFGFGRIARRVAVAGRALGMITIAHDPHLNGSADPDVELVDADELWRRSDVLSLHAPATPATYHVVDAATLAAMPAGSFLVNCARGSLVDHDALVDALVRGQLAGAALDVTEPEPLPADHPLREHPQRDRSHRTSRRTPPSGGSGCTPTPSTTRSPCWPVNGAAWCPSSAADRGARPMSEPVFE